MHPDLEDFLEDAFAGVKQTTPEIGRVVVEPDYDVTPDGREAEPLAQELRELLAGYTKPGDVAVDSRFGLLKKYLRSVTLHPDPIEGAWVEVAPPGNWI